jgi:hypothetical protein
MRTTRLLITLFSLGSCHLFPQFSFDTIFSRDPFLTKISRDSAKCRLQIVYTQVDTQNGKPVFTDFFYNVSPSNYFYCASLVKLPVAVLSLQKLNEIGVSPNAIMYTDSSRACHRKVRKDTTSANGYPSVGQYIKRMLLVSENEAYGRLYEFLGVDYIHGNLRKMGFPDVRIMNRYDGNCAGKDNLITNPVTFLDSALNVVYRQQEQYATGNYELPVKNTFVGKAYYDAGGKKINSPRSFATSNYMRLTDCHLLLRELIYDEEKKFNINGEQRQFLLQQLSMFPRQSASPRYDPKVYYDSYKKYLFYGDSKAGIKDTSIIITNIVGQSYGFMSDCAHFYDKKNKIEFMLSAVIYANEDEVLNDGKYDYKTIALPYLAELGRQFYNYESRRKK